MPVTISVPYQRVPFMKKSASASSKHQMEDFLPSYQLHKYLNRHLDDVINDSKLLDPPSYTETLGGRVASVASAAAPTDTSSHRSATRSSVGSRSSRHDGEESLVSDQNNSVWSKIDSLAYINQDAVYIDIQLDDFTNIHYSPYTSGDILNGVIKVSNISSRPIPFENIYVSFEGYFWTARSGTKMLMNNFLDMVDFTASCLYDDPDSGLPLDKILRPIKSYSVRFSFEIPDCSKQGFKLPPSLGDLHLRWKISSQIQEMRYLCETNTRHDYSSTDFSVSYSVNARLLELSDTKTKLVIRRHSRHLVDFIPGPGVPEKKPHYLSPADELRLLIDSIEDHVASLDRQASPPAKDADPQPSQRNSFKFPQDTSRVLNLRVKSSSHGAVFVQKTLAATPALMKLSPDKPLTMSFDKIFKIKSVELYALNYFSLAKIPVSVLADWFINEQHYNVAKTRAESLQVQLESMQSDESFTLTKGLSTLKYSHTKIPKALKRVGKKEDSRVELLLCKNKQTQLVPSFEFQYCGRFYFLRFTLALSGGLTYNGKPSLEHDVPVLLID